MEKYNDIKYDKYRGIISDLIKQEKGNENVFFAGGVNEKELVETISAYAKFIGFSITIEDWNNLCILEIEEHRKTKEVKSIDGVVFSSKEVNNFKIPIERDSAWQTFKKFSLKKINGFDDDTINNIEKDVFQTIQNLSIETKPENPTKGLVIGGVQSGKTTNIASLIAMATDMDFNMFIVMSGVVDNLRIQTESRLRQLLDPIGNKRFRWEYVGNERNETNNMLSKLYADNKKFYTVILKQKTRLEDLIRWLSMDANIASKLKILVIDDESDQASANTSKDPEFERKTINRLVVNLVHSRGIMGEQNKKPFKAMNYIGYTATPYANILSESPDNEDSLYPRNFISLLTKSNRHFGPTEIFGELGTENDGIDIVRKIKNPLTLKELREETSVELPIELKESIAYFVSAAASLRKHEYGKPVSMLVQVSHKRDDHQMLRQRILRWINHNKRELFNLAKEMWERELNKITINDFDKKVFVNESKTMIKQKFEDFEELVKQIINEIAPIERDTYTNKLIYHEGIHLVVDNSDTKYDEEGIEHRLYYPTQDEDKKTTPIFLIIGGDTLSRGLTLEGLVSTYFLRTPSAADTLTQMGRWFGYRINYELFPRIWMTQRTKTQFKYIALLEQELRNEINEMKTLGLNPSEVGPKIKTLPQYISVTSKSKSYAMKSAEYDFSGYSSQTYIFDNDLNIQKNNLKIGEDFINSLGKPTVKSIANKDNVYWERVSFSKIKDMLLKKFKFNNRIKALNNIDILINWIDKATNEGKLRSWNVILGGLGKVNNQENDWSLKHFKYNMVSRTKKEDSMENEIDIGVLRSPSDLFADIDLTKISDENKSKIREAIQTGSRNLYNDIRIRLGLSKVPQLILYKINKNSIPRSNSKRIELGIDTDLFGIYISIPGRGKNDYTTYVTVSIKDIPNIDLEVGDQDDE